MVEYLMYPNPDPRFRGGVRPADPPGLSHVAVGLWVATFVVLAWPHRQHRVSEEDLIRAYGVTTTTFGLL